MATVRPCVECKHKYSTYSPYKNGGPYCSAPALMIDSRVHGKLSQPCHVVRCKGECPYFEASLWQRIKSFL